MCYVSQSIPTGNTDVNGIHMETGPVQSRGYSFPGSLSFPHRRESIVGGLVPRLRGEDGLERDLDASGDFAQALG